MTDHVEPHAQIAALNILIGAFAAAGVAPDEIRGQATAVIDEFAHHEPPIWLLHPDDLTALIRQVSR